MTGKGHVPEENRLAYRRLADLAYLLQRMGGQVSGIGEYDDANRLWAMAAKYKDKANELRTDLPQPPPGPVVFDDDLEERRLY
jgi:hypothetical protein